ncbi:alpha/beta hydrolase [Ancylothrix sp. C2]|uniref:YqiA/YcfP family alpha/beta fold hydrolase n=1 Tax=Ancylothrix sp. D3o TaxID=2953691 RepID=UPI0021BAF5D7|nr:YqiA/YcfP family alpha/beta fold hydrolase [Ancylothrix sp. D3o]MCT7951164.1 alpha/beta hydrolase [Ancylothrix sp. D3o]
MTHYIYLHGFASSPLSAKAVDIKQRFAKRGIDLKVPDLNQNDFSGLTLSRQLQQVAAEFSSPPLPTVIIGSSFGGLTAAWLAEKYPQVERIILLAPAFGFLNHWRAKLGKEKLEEWEREGVLPVYHYGKKQMLPLKYEFFKDCAGYAEGGLGRKVPTLILHGIDDDVIPIQSSRDYAKSRNWVEVVELKSDHPLGDVVPQIWQEIGRFCELEAES